MKHTDPLERIVNLTDFERRSALCYLAGYAPDALISALDEMDRQREVFQQHRSAFQSWSAGVEAHEPIDYHLTGNPAAEWFDAEAMQDVADEDLAFGPRDGIDFQILQDDTGRWIATCNACGSETPWTTTYDQAVNMATAHVNAEWMNR